MEKSFKDLMNILDKMDNVIIYSYNYDKYDDDDFIEIYINKEKYDIFKRPNRMGLGENSYEQRYTMNQCHNDKGEYRIFESNNRKDLIKAINKIRRQIR